MSVPRVAVAFVSGGSAVTDDNGLFQISVGESRSTVAINLQDVSWEIADPPGPERAVQGNLDPAALFAPRPELARQIDRVLEEAGPEPGHIFNLGHGIERTTDPDAMAFLIDYVHEKTARAS